MPWNKIDSKLTPLPLCHFKITVLRSAVYIVIVAQKWVHSLALVAWHHLCRRLIFPKFNFKQNPFYIKE